MAGNLVDYDGVSRTYNAANQMTYDDTNTLTYDNNGNLRTVGSDTYTWDRANRLLSVGNHEYVYDGLGNRVQQTVSSVVTDYLNDVQPALTKLLKQTTGANVEQFVHAPRGIHAVDDGTDWNFYAQDGLGSVRAVVDDSAVVQSSMSFDPYGNPMGSYEAGFGFTGEQTDENGAVFLRARYYEPALGVFSAIDPFEGVQNRPMSLNGYSWVEGNVVNATDPTGMQSFMLDSGLGLGQSGGKTFAAQGGITPVAQSDIAFASQMNIGYCGSNSSVSSDYKNKDDGRLYSRPPVVAQGNDTSGCQPPSEYIPYNPTPSLLEDRATIIAFEESLLANLIGYSVGKSMGADPLEAIFGTLGFFSIAARHLAHYLGGTGIPLNVNVNRLARDLPNSFAFRVQSSVRDTLLRQVTQEISSLNSGTDCQMLDLLYTDWEWVNGDFVADESIDWHWGTASFWYSFGARTAVRFNADNTYMARVCYKVFVSDVYDWHSDLGIPDMVLGAQDGMNLAKDYRLMGQTETVCFDYQSTTQLESALISLPWD